MVSRSKSELALWYFSICVSLMFSNVFSAWTTDTAHTPYNMTQYSRTWRTVNCYQYSSKEVVKEFWRKATSSAMLLLWTEWPPSTACHYWLRNYPFCCIHYSRNSEKLSLPVEKARSHLIYGSLLKQVSPPANGISTGSAILQGSLVCPTDRRTNRQTYPLYMTSVAISHMFGDAV